MECDNKKELIKYFKTLGIEVYTNTKARGHQGIFFKNRIDISKNIEDEKIVPTLLHEFTHYINSKIEPDLTKNGGSLETIFDIEATHYAEISVLEKELLQVTFFVDKHASNQSLRNHKEQIKNNIKKLEVEIKKDYPKFMRSKKFKEFERFIKKSKAKYLLKYDRVKYISPIFWGLSRKYEIYTIDRLEQDFPEIPPAFCAYIRLKSAQRKQRRISARINKYTKYYLKPTELFARFVEGLYEDDIHVRAIAPRATQRFFILLESGYYLELKTVFEMLNKNTKFLGVVGI